MLPLNPELAKFLIVVLLPKTLVTSSINTTLSEKKTHFRSTQSWYTINLWDLFTWQIRSLLVNNSELDSIRNFYNSVISYSSKVIVKSLLCGALEETFAEPDHFLVVKCNARAAICKP